MQRDVDADRDQSTRREYLKLVTAGAATPAVLGGAAGTASAASVPPGDPSPIGSPIGGGKEYDRKVSGGEYTVTTRDDLIEKVESVANPGETVYVPNDAKINLGTRTNIQISQGVTLASGRGIDGAPGGLLYTDEFTGDDQPAFFEVNSSNVRITGLRFQGPRTDYFNPGPEPPCTDGPQADDPECLEARAERATMAVTFFAPKGEIDNCEMYGWPQTAIMTGSISNVIDAHIHHNSLHNNQMEGLGYGVSIIRGDPMIEWNFFDRNRHSITASGRPDCSYTARYNIVDEATSHAFDMHQYEDQAGTTIRIYRNTFSFTDSHVKSYSADGQEAFAIKGVPTDVARLTKNWFYHPHPPDDKNVDEQGPAFRQVNAPGNTWTNLEHNNNHYGKDVPPKGIGAPRTGDNDTGDGGGDGGDEGNGGDGTNGDGGGSSGSSVPAEIGVVTKDADSWRKVSFDGSYSNPVVIMKPVSQFNGRNPCHARVRNVTGTGFEYRIEEWDYLNGIHRPETIHYLVMEHGTHTVNGMRIDVGTVRTDEWFRDVRFAQKFETRPVVFTQTQTVTGPNAVVTRNTHVDTADVMVRLQEQRARSKETKGHTEETVGYIAIEPGTVQGTSVELGRVSGVSDSWQRISFDGTYSSPQFIADMQTINNGDPATLRYKNLDPTGVDIQIEEETSEDAETTHPAETVGYFVTSGSGQL